MYRLHSEQVGTFRREAVVPVWFRFEQVYTCTGDWGIHFLKTLSSLW